MELRQEETGREPDGWKLLESLRPRMVYGKSQMIYLQGELADRFYYLSRGRVRIFLSSPDGMEKTLTIRESGAIFGEAAFFDGMPRMSSARTMEKSEIIPVGRQALLELIAREPSLALWMLEYMGRTVRMLSAQVDGMAFLQADRRIAQLLLHLSRPDAAGDPLVQATHEEIGSLAGTSRITVSRILASFGRRGWITTRYRAILIRDPAAIERFASLGEPA